MRARTMLVSCCILLAAAGARATTLMRMSLEKLAASASAIARVRCLANTTYWEEGEIWTLTVCRVLEVWKGSLPPQITIRLMGGRIGHVISLVPGVPHFEPGEEVALFLEPGGHGSFTVTSWMQGTFRIHRDRYTGRATVTQDTAGYAVFDSERRRFFPSGLRDVPLDAFRQRVLEAEPKGKRLP